MCDFLYSPTKRRKTNKISNAIGVGYNGDVSNVSPIFKYMMDTEEEIKMLVLNFPNSIDTVKEFVTESEFRYAGLLRKETIKGDVEQYVY